ncbi:dynamin related protein 1 isoform a [Anaeramoeba flamelloides]|uniref:Dynamin related protein 1 isoform a n=1 Tax=Anaeramoeba flamelloides TaxID=1746091 RepID=A0AAV7Z1V0_9EUKA|nr:dynamin related protein 1 isoform a [Anaeramoeba flamelloides]
MKSLIKITNKLHRILSEVKYNKIKLPEIIVVGEQSSGKTSVLESIVGIDFLPRGTGIVTRRPLVLELVRSRSTTKQKQKKGPYAKFSHLKNQIFPEFDKVREEIKNQTNQLEKDQISDQPLYLKIFSPKLVDLTLIDLPGLTKNATINQPLSIVETIEKMVLKYISNPKSLLLAIIPATQDIATSDALRICKRVDPNGDRTLGVITKLDLLDKGVDVMPILEGKLFPLKLGYIPVINRSQEDINKGKDIRKAHIDEENFFQNHKVYKLLQNKYGIKYLTERLSSLFIGSIQQNVPSLVESLNRELKITKSKLKSLGTPPNGSNKSSLLSSIISEFSTKYTDLIEGRGLELEQSMTKLQGGARLNFVFYDIFKVFLEGIDPTVKVSNKEIEIILQNTQGIRKSLFVTDTSFEILVKSKISLLKKPCLQCAEQSLKELENILREQIALPRLDRFIELRNRIISTSIEYINQLFIPACEFIKNLISIETAYINVDHPQFISPKRLIIKENKNKKLKKKKKKKNKNNERKRHLEDGLFKNLLSNFTKKSRTNTDNKHKNGKNANSNKMDLEIPNNIIDIDDDEDDDDDNRQLKEEVDIIKQLISNYFKIIKSKIGDTIPKGIVHYLIKKSTKNLQEHLFQNILKDEKILDLLVEDNQTKMKRIEYNKTIKAYSKSLTILKKIDIDITNLQKH